MSNVVTLPQEQADSCVRAEKQPAVLPELQQQAKTGATKKLRLHCPILLLCERRDMAEFLSVYMRYLFKQGVTLPNLQLINLGSFKELPKFLHYVEENEDLRRLQKIRFLCDAGPSVRTRQKQLMLLKNTSFLRDFAHYQYFLFPGKQTNGYWLKGYLEDALMQALQLQTAECADFTNLVNVTRDFLVGVQACRQQKTALVNESRHLLHAYLAGTEGYVGLSIGDAAKAGAFELGSDVFASLRKMLEEL